MSSSDTKISSTFSEPTMNIMPTVASNSSAKYSPTCSVNVESMESHAVKMVSTSTACLSSCVNGSTTNIPCQASAVVCCCTWNIQKMGSKHPMPVIAAATNRRHFPSVDRISPRSTNSTANAAMDTMVSGIASVRRSK